jgi:hypothetical protein
MIDLIISWTKTAPEDVKICVSSREYNVFLRSFSDNRRLRLQDLTRGDMERYVRDRLCDVREAVEADIESLVKAVADKSSGIFLWVALVVKSLRERLEDGYALATLERQLDVLPDELEDLFRYLLQSISKSARAKVYRTFAIVLQSTTYEFDLSLDRYYFLDDYEADPEFAMKSSFGMNEPSAIERRDIARKRLNGCCRSLVELSESRETFTVEFTHRSVPEFLEKEDTRRDMDSLLQRFSPEDALAQLFLAELRATQQGGYDMIDLSGRVYFVIRMLHQSKTDSPPYCWREFLHSALLEYEGRDPKDATIGQGTIWTGWSGRSLAPEGDGREVTSPLHISAFLGDYEYVAWKLARDATIIDTDLKKSLLFGWVEAGAVSESNLGCFQLLDLFLKEAGLSSQSVIHTEPLIPGFPTDVELTFWQTFIIRSAFEYIPEHDTGSLTKRIRHHSREYHHNFGEIIEKFLRLGADPHLWIWVPDGPRSKELAQRPPGYAGGYGHPEVCELIAGREGRKIVYTAQIAIETLEFIDRKVGRVTLRDLVLFWRLDNTETLLELIDTKFDQREEPAAGKGMAVPQTSLQTGTKPTSENGEEVVKRRAQDLGRFWPWFELLPKRQFATFLFGKYALAWLLYQH